MFLPAVAVLLAAVAIGLMLFLNQGAGERRDRAGSSDAKLTNTEASAEADGVSGVLTRDNEPAADVDANYIGTARCAQCHAEAMQEWEGSHHDRAMEKPTAETVEGDFSGVTFTKEGITSRFFKKDGDYYIHTEGPDGQMRDYKVAYTFGVYPLQQYLVAFPDGRLQTLSLCWDNRPADQGGQRWFHIRPDQRIKPDDPLFWTQSLQNWNMQCAECHSTNLKKNYDPEKDQYHTSFAQLDVSCEACHGPGSEHAAWAERYGDKQNQSAGGDEASDKNMGLTVKMAGTNPGTWTIDPKTNQPKRTQPLQNRVQMQVCSRCHARRSVTSESFVPGQNWLETHQPTLLEQPAYHPDGRIDGEVYVWGSFRQSKMYHSGVRCTDCHNPHSTELKIPKAQLCMKCHNGAKYQSPEHHFHERGSAGASCVNCHMPEETYMVVDPRSDHSFRIPRPDRSVQLGTPNTCNDCHQDKSYQWAADKYRQWWGSPGKADRPYAYALDAAWEDHPAAGRKLNQVARHLKTPTIAQATALARLRQYPSRMSLETIRQTIDAEDKLTRLAAVRALGAYRGNPDMNQRRWGIGQSALNDPSRLVRLAAARALAGTAPSLPEGDQAEAYAAALAELRGVHRQNSDRAGTLVSKGNLERDLNRPKQAIEAYQSAMDRNPHYVGAYVNLADLYREQDKEAKVEQALRAGLEHSPKAPGLHHALALSLFRQDQRTAAIDRLERATELAPDNPGYASTLAIGYNDTGRPEKAIATLEAARKHKPQSRQVLLRLATIARDHGQYDKAREAAQKLTELAPNNRRYRALLRQIEQRVGP
jgi:predicted CXXCH cytochrome family protein